MLRISQELYTVVDVAPETMPCAMSCCHQVGPINKRSLSPNG